MESFLLNTPLIYFLIFGLILFIWIFTEIKAQKVYFRILIGFIIVLYTAFFCMRGLELRFWSTSSMIADNLKQMELLNNAKSNGVVIQAIESFNRDLENFIEIDIALNNLNKKLTEERIKRKIPLLKINLRDENTKE